MLVFLIIIEIILTALLLAIIRRFRSNLPEIAILFKKLVYINRELKGRQRIDSDKYNRQEFDPSGIRLRDLKLPSRLIDRKKFACKTYESAARDYAAFFRPPLIIAGLWAAGMILLLWQAGR